MSKAASSKMLCLKNQKNLTDKKLRCFKDKLLFSIKDYFPLNFFFHKMKWQCFLQKNVGKSIYCVCYSLDHTKAPKMLMRYVGWRGKYPYTKPLNKLLGKNGMTFS